jgi:predicted metal-dependent hydrolase
MTETLQLGELVFEVRRSARRKTLGLTVDRAGELVAHVPFGTPVEDLTRWINKKLLWVYRKLALKQEAAPKVHAPEYVSGEAFCYLGRRFSLKVVAKQERPFQFDGTRFILRRDARPAEAHFRRWYLETGTEWLRHRVERLSHHTTRMPNTIEVRDLGFRWGSCGKAGVLYFNWKVLQLPVRLLDYIINATRGFAILVKAPGAERRFTPLQGETIVVLDKQGKEIWSAKIPVGIDNPGIVAYSVQIDLLTERDFAKFCQNTWTKSPAAPTTAPPPQAPNPIRARLTCLQLANLSLRCWPAWSAACRSRMGIRARTRRLTANPLMDADGEQAPGGGLFTTKNAGTTKKVVESGLRS